MVSISGFYIGVSLFWESTMTGKDNSMVLKEFQQADSSVVNLIPVVKSMVVMIVVACILESK